MKRSLWWSATRLASLLGLLLALGTTPTEARIIKTYRLQVGSLNEAQAAEALRRQVIPRVPIPVFVDELQGVYKVTAGDFPTYQEAVAYKDRLYGEGLEGAFVVEVLSSVSDQPTGPVIYQVQVGNFGSLVNARQLQEELQRRGVQAVDIERMESFYKVRVGQYQNRSDALKAQEILREAGYPDAWVAESRASETRVGRNVISMAPASAASITPPRAEMRPESLRADQQFQVAVGPYTTRPVAEQTQGNLLREGFSDVRLTPSAGIFLVEVGPPTSLLEADTLRRTLRDKGFLNVVLNEQPRAPGQEAPPSEIALAQAPEPAVPPEVAQRLKELQSEVERLRQESPVESPQKMAEAHVKAAQRLMDSGHWEAARDQYQLALSYEPDNPQALDGLSASLNAIREAEGTSRPLLEAAEKMLQQGEYNAARVQFKLILEQDPTNSKALEGLARAEEHLKAPPVASPSRPSPPPSPPDTGVSRQIQALLEKSNTAIAQGQLAQAKSFLEEARQLQPDNGLVAAGLEQVNQMLARRQAEQQREEQPGRQPAEEPGTSWVGLFVWLILIVIVLGGAAATVYFFFLRKRGAKPAETRPDLTTKLKILGLKPGEKPSPKAGPKEKREKQAGKPRREAPSPDEDLPESLMKSAQPSPPPEAEAKPEQPKTEKEPFAPSEPEAVPESAPESSEAEVEAAFEETIAERQAALEAKPEPEGEPPKAPAPPEKPPARAPAKPSGALEIKFEQSYNQLQVGDEVDSWKGGYESASLTVSQNRLIAGANHYLKFVKEPCAEETLYCMLIPEAGPRPVFEFELCCLGVNEHPIGLYLESVDNEAVSVPMTFHTDPETQQVRFTLEEQTLEYAPGDWKHIRCEIDLEGNRYSVRVDGKEVLTDAALAGSVKNFDMISLKAQPETEGTLLLNNLKVYSTQEA